jgi:hypothetical protein
MREWWSAGVLNAVGSALLFTRIELAGGAITNRRGAPHYSLRDPFARN